METKKVILVCEPSEEIRMAYCLRFSDKKIFEVIECPDMDAVIEYLQTHPLADALLIREQAAYGPKSEVLRRISTDGENKIGGLSLILFLDEIRRLPPKVFLTSMRQFTSPYGFEARRRVVELIGGGAFFREIPATKIIDWITTLITV